MSEILKNVLYVITAGVLLFVGVFVLKFVLRFTWKIVRTALIILSLVIIAGYFFGFFRISDLITIF